MMTPMQLSAASNDFGFDIWHQIEGEIGNISLSPVSIATALTMALGGARGKTAEQMIKVLHLSGSSFDNVMIEWGALASGLRLGAQDDNIEVVIANRLFGDRGYDFEKAYLDATLIAYGASLQPTDFQNAPDYSRKVINSWVEQETRNRIKNLLPAGGVTSDTRLVLTNALYFLAKWRSAFNEKLTKMRPFHNHATEHSVPTMYKKGRFEMSHLINNTMLKLPYSGDHISMLVVLSDYPKQVTQVSRTEFDILRSKLVAVEDVEVELPKFEVSTPTVDLAPILQNLGMESAFDPRTADFTGICAADPTSKEHLNLSSVFHKTFIKVDESGTEAAAATAAVMVSRGFDPNKKVHKFTVDHPFLYFIVDDSVDNLILMMGRIEDPRQ